MGRHVSNRQKKQKKQRKTYIVLFALLLAIGIALFFVLHEYSLNGSDKDKQGNYRLSKSMQSDISEVENVGNFIRTKSFIENGRPQYDLIFGNNLVIGDSISEGLLAYGFLKESQVICEVGGSVMKSSSAIDSAVRIAPQNVFFSYGTNDMGMYSGNAEAFVKQYRSVIEEFMERSPDTKVFVNSIPKPGDDKIASGGQFYKWEEFNREIENMCKSLGIKYIDNTYILKDHPELYGGDGIHVSPSYYPYWLNNMIKNKG